MKTNATRATKATRGELDQARITNEYRVMFGRAAVLVHDLLTVAAHGHCEDMTRARVLRAHVARPRQDDRRTTASASRG